MKFWPILFLGMFCFAVLGGCSTQEPAQAPPPTAQTAPTKTAAAETPSPEELAQRDFDIQVLVFKKWVETYYGMELTALNQPHLPGDPVAMSGSERSWPRDQHIAFVRVCKRQAGPRPQEGIDRVRKMCEDGAARYKQLAEHPYAQKHPWELPKRPEFDADFLIKEYQERAEKWYQYQLKQLRDKDPEAAQEVESGIVVSAAERAAREKEKADRAAHQVDKKRLKDLGNFIEWRATSLVPEYQNNSLQTADLRLWIEYGTELRKRDAEMKLFGQDQLKSLREACREMKEVVERVKISSARFEDPVPLPEPASYEPEALLAKHGKKVSEKIFAEHEKTMAPYSPTAVKLLKEGKSTPEEIVAAVVEERKANLAIILEKRQKILATMDEARQKFEAATTLEEMKAAVAEADRIHKEPLYANENEINRWRGDSQILGLLELRQLAELPPERNPVSRMYTVLEKIDKKKLDINDPAVRAKLLPLYAK